MFCFTSGEGTAQNAKAIFHRMLFQHLVNVDYEFSLASSLGLTQEIRGPIQQIITQPLGLSHLVDRQHAVPAPSFLSGESLGLSHIVVHAGSFGGGGGESGPETFSSIFNSNTVTGQPVYVVDATHVDLADNTTNFLVIGLAIEDVTSGNSGEYITEGSVTRNDWTLVTGTTLLTPGAVYYLDNVQGKLTSIPTTTVGEHVVAVARAATDKKLDIEIAEPILL